MSSSNISDSVVFNRSDIWLAVSILLVCIAPYVGSFMVIGAFLINIFRLFRYDIHTFMFDTMCLMPFANIYKVVPATPSLVLVLIVIGSIWYLLKGLGNGKPVPFVLIIACFCFVLQSDFIIDALASIICSLLLVCIFAQNINNRDVVKVSYGYIISVSASVIVAYLSLSTNAYIAYISEDIQVGSFTDAIRFKGLFMDPNYLGTYLLSALSILCQLFIVKRIDAKLFLLFFFIMAYAGLISFSKSFFLMIIVISVLAMFFLWKRGNKKWATLYTIGFVILIAYSLKGAITEVDIVMERFSQDSDMDDLTTGRASLWSKYADNIFSSLGVLLVGKGLGAPILGLGAHNLYLETLYYVGSIGLFLIIMSYLASFKTTLIFFKRYSLSYKGIASLSLIVLLIVYWSLQGLFSFATYFQFFIAFLMFRVPSLNRE